MDQKTLFDGLATFLCVIVIITFHEFGHAWAAWKCGDDTARSQGRITLNPIAHMDFVGTLVLPLLVVFLSAAGSGMASFIIGWGKPVPVNVNNLRRPRIDDILVSLAGPAMNVVLAFLAMLIARAGFLAHSDIVPQASLRMAEISMFLCFFNLLPIPPLDGSHVVKNIFGIKHETFLRFSQFGFFLIILAIQIPQVQRLLSDSTHSSLEFMSKLVRLGSVAG